MSSGGLVVPTHGAGCCGGFVGLAAALIGFWDSAPESYASPTTSPVSPGMPVSWRSRRGGTGGRHLIDRLADDSGRPVTLVPVGTKGVDDVRESLVEGVRDPSRVKVDRRSRRRLPMDRAAPVLLVVRLGEDTRRQLDSSHRALKAANDHFVGVVAVSVAADSQERRHGSRRRPGPNRSTRRWPRVIRRSTRSRPALPHSTRCAEDASATVLTASVSPSKPRQDATVRPSSVVRSPSRQLLARGSPQPR